MRAKRSKSTLPRSLVLRRAITGRARKASCTIGSGSTTPRPRAAARKASSVPLTSANREGHPPRKRQCTLHHRPPVAQEDTCRPNGAHLFRAQIGHGDHSCPARSGRSPSAPRPGHRHALGALRARANARSWSDHVNGVAHLGNSAPGCPSEGKRMPRDSRGRSRGPRNQFCSGHADRYRRQPDLRPRVGKCPPSARVGALGAAGRAGVRTPPTRAAMRCKPIAARCPTG